MKKIVILFFVLTVVSCGEKPIKVQKEIRVERPIVPQPKEITSVQIPERKKYVYEGLMFRDPFVPLTGEKVAKAKLGLTKDAVVPSLGNLELKGIIIGKEEKMALFSSLYGSYIFINGKLYDNQNRLVKGISGKMLSNSIVLVTESGVMKEFPFPKSITTTGITQPGSE